MTVIEGVRAAAPDLRSGLSDLRDAIPTLNLRELRPPTAAREALSDLRDAVPDAGIVVPAVTAGLAEIRESLPAAPWTKKRPSTPQRVVIVVVAGIAVLAAAWLLTAMLDRRRQRKIDRDRKLTSATGERPLVADEPRAKGMDVPAAEPTAKSRRAIEQERVATDQERVATGLNGAREGTAVSVIEP